MGKEDFYRVILYFVNIIFALFGLSIAATGIWFFVQVNEIVQLRNTNHYLLDYRVYWPQVTPWLFILLGVFIMIIAFCGWCGAQRESSGMLGTYALFLSLLIVGQLLVAILVFVFVNGEDTDRFIKDTIYDAFQHTKEDPEALSAYGRFERRLRCCGANDARDYKSWRYDLPPSCCVDSHYVTVCDFTNKEANERYGCAKVASVYAKIISSIIAGVSLIMVVIEVVGVIVGYKMCKAVEGEDHYLHERKAEAETDF